MNFAEPVLLDASELFLELGRMEPTTWRVRAVSGSNSAQGERPVRVVTEGLPPGPWRSLGKCLDYSNWPARERFRELDAAIALRGRADIEGSDAISVVASGREHAAAA